MFKKFEDKWQVSLFGVNDLELIGHDIIDFRKDKQQNSLTISLTK
jgi:hypothetical protein